MTKPKTRSVAIGACTGVLFLTACDGDTVKVYEKMVSFGNKQITEQYIVKSNLEAIGPISCTPPCHSRIIVMRRDLRSNGMMSEQQRITLDFDEGGSLIAHENEVVWKGP